jgi:predicted DsbA family dithiol-disulfide isomerase
MNDKNNTEDHKKKATVNVTITSDLICPWCYIGLRKLQEASKVAQVEVNIAWKPFLLQPRDMPEEGLAKCDATPASRVGSHLKDAGASVGINFTGLTDRTPNTELFHATMQRILELDGMRLQTSFQEAVFDAYFTRGVFPDEVALLDLAEQVGVQETVKALYKNPDKLGKLKKAIVCEAQAASRRGITGVPAFSFNGEPAFSGAKDVGTFVKYLQHYSHQEAGLWTSSVKSVR